MSEISKAKQRMFNNKNIALQYEYEHQQRKISRKFTLSSLAHQQDKKYSADVSPANRLIRHNTTNINRNQPFNTPAQQKSEVGHISTAKENTPFKKINIKVQQTGQIQNSHLNFYMQKSISQLKDNHQYKQSPPKVIYRQLLHRDKIDVVMVPPQTRKHHSPYKPKQCMIQWAQQFIGQQRTSGKNFVDDFFPPSRTIIFSKKILYNQQGLQFQRLSRIYHNQITIANSFQSTYLSLGKYTNPYLYSALTILAEDPPKILALFGNQQANENGIYYVNLCKDGVWRYVIVDDFVPVKIYQGKKYLLFIHSREVQKTIQIWASLIEKAIAKIYGTYFDLSMIRNEGMSDLFRILTGAPISQYQITKDFRSYLILIDSALKRKHVVTLQMIPQEYQQTADMRKLNIYQAYKVLQIKKSGLKLRNYSQPDLITKLAFDQCLIFSRLIIYRLQPSYRYITHKLRHKKLYFSKLKLTISHKTKAYFQVWQNNPAYYKKHLGSHIDYNLSKVKIWIGRQDQQGDSIQRGKQIDLAQGIYQLHIHLCQQKEYDFTLSYYGQRQVQMQRIKNMEEWYGQCSCKPAKKK